MPLVMALKRQCFVTLWQLPGGWSPLPINGSRAM